MSVIYLRQMKKYSSSKKILPLLPFSILTLLILPESTQAVPPPDFLFNVGSQIAQFFSIAAIFLSAIFATMYKFIKIRMDAMGSKKILVIVIGIIAIGGISLSGAYAYGQFKQNEEYKKWLAESEAYANLPQEQAEYWEEVPREQSKKSEESYGEVPRDLAVDKLSMEETAETKEKIQESAETNAKFIDNIENSSNDTSSQFIKKYYEEIANGNTEKAYEMSKKSVSLATFKDWYKQTTKITLDQLSRIDDNTSSVELTMYEDDNYTRYGVLMKLKFENDEPIQISSSDVRLLSEGSTIKAAVPKTDTPKIITTETPSPSDSNSSDFYKANKDYPKSISNNDFQKVLDKNADNYIVLDAREDLEYNNGYFPGSKHIRYADLQAGKWIEVPNDKYIYVLCWSGIRGKEVAEFLRTKNIVATYLENGANGWVSWEGDWVGNIKFSEKYEGEKYKKIFTTNEVKKKAASGVILVDSRQPWKFESYHIPGSVNIPIMYTPTINLEDTFAQIPANSTVITMCDDYVNCFDAKITAVELENRGHTFIGRYNKPWEYE